jgi:hypothetical protein
MTTQMDCPLWYEEHPGVALFSGFRPDPREFSRQFLKETFFQVEVLAWMNQRNQQQA